MAGAFDAGAHLIEHLRQGHDFGLARGIAQDRLALGQGGGHHQILGAGDRGDIEIDVSAHQPVGNRFDISVLQMDRSTQTFQPFEMQIDRPRTDGTAAGQ